MKSVVNLFKDILVFTLAKLSLQGKSGMCGNITVIYLGISDKPVL